MPRREAGLRCQTGAHGRAGAGLLPCRRERPLMRSTAGCAGPGYDGGGAALGRPSAGMGQEMVPEGLKLVPDGALHCMVHGVQLPSDALWNSSCAESPVSRPNVTVPGLLGAV